MKRYCTLCGHEIADQKRIRRGSPYCSDDCRRQARREARADLGARKCRLCGRVTRKPKRDSGACAPGAQPDLPTEHEASMTWSSAQWLGKQL